MTGCYGACSPARRTACRSHAFPKRDGRVPRLSWPTTTLKAKNTHCAATGVQGRESNRPENCSVSSGAAGRAQRNTKGYWLYELEADCTIPAEYIMMMHFLDEIDAPLQAKIANHLRARQAEHGGWPLYHNGELDLSCTVKAYYALKLAGDDVHAPHMTRARTAILERGGAARANVFTRIALALFGELPWRGVPYIPVEIMLLPKWFPFHLDKVSYWSRTVM